MARVYLGVDPDSGKREYHNETIHGNKKAAEGELTRMLRDRDTGKLTAGAAKRIMGTLFDDLRADYEINGKSVAWAEIVVEKHLRPFLGRVAISKLSTDHVQRYIAHRRREGVSNGTINREFNLLRRSLNLGRMSTPPKVTRAPRIPRLAEAAPRKGFFEHETYIAMHEALLPDVKPVLTFAYHTGCRKGEILMLQWPQVDLMERVVRLEPGTTKNEEARLLPLAPQLYESLKSQRTIRTRSIRDCPWVFFWHDTGKRIRDFRGAWEAASKTAGVWEGDEETGKPTKLFHDLRRTGVRNLIRAGVPEAVAMRISGHKTRSVFDRYNIVSEADLKDAALRLGEYLGRKEAETIPHTILQQQAGKGSGWSPKMLLNYSIIWCGEGHLNPHEIAPASTSS